MTDTRRLVTDYVLHRFRSKNLPWSTCPDPDPGRVERTMRLLGDEIQERYTQVFDEMCSKQLDVTSLTFEATANELFRNGINWGRVAALVAFSGSLAVKCVQNETPHLVDKVIQWSVDYIDAHLQPWIQQSGSWDGLVEFHERRPHSPGCSDESAWPSFSTLCGCAVGAIGVITLGALFSQRS